MKPEAWQCPACLYIWVEPPDGRCVCLQRHKKLIPCFPPLDAPEPTTWGESGGDDAVCQEPAAKNASWFVMGFDAGKKPRIKSAWLGELVFIVIMDGEMLKADIAEAIRHVAEEDK